MRKLLASTVLIGVAAGLLAPNGEAIEPARATREPSRGNGEETALERRSNGHFYVTAAVDGEPVEFVVDTGATGVALTIADAERIGVPFDREQFERVGTGASGPVRGQRVMLGSIDIDGKEVSDVEGAVLDGLEVSLLGQSYLSQIGGVEMSGNQMVLR